MARKKFDKIQKSNTPISQNLREEKDEHLKDENYSNERVSPADLCRISAANTFSPYDIVTRGRYQRNAYSCYEDSARRDSYHERHSHINRFLTANAVQVWLNL